ncbi:MAG: UDP-N-acetylglucosamine 1-carboxyvinyltransferase [Bdellovibrionaceae bacterium]|nr:UDP-N-acetylglucosamine 1-carboxyvinyltransferase [Pseudobdellovibrionaceae bacterium]|tara:strand:- start:85 stop:1344 length:1260 start_codon:yes stop_codon:yes gene_type:complete
MDKMWVKGGNTLNGRVSASGAKNAVLPIVFSSLLADGKHRFENVPDLLDIKSTQVILESLGCTTQYEAGVLSVEVEEPKEKLAHYDYVRKMRASVLVLGPLLARYGEAKVSLPGGCAIGTRPVNMHLEAMEALGATVDIAEGYIIASAEGGLKGGRILFETATVGGTENALMAAVLAKGETVIENAAKEPEVVDLCNYLIKMGAQISGVGTGILTIKGVDQLKPAQHRIIPDRIEAGTLLIAGAITGGEVTVTNCEPQDLQPLIAVLREAGFKVDTGYGEVTVRPQSQWRAVDVTTSPHPGFPTDLQAQYMALMTQADGTSLITESVFENRFMHVQELTRMNADITPKTRVAVIRGEKGQLTGAPVMATDLRASACLVLAGLVAKGETVVSRIYHLDRGYDQLEKKLQSLGAEIKRVSE